VCRGASRTESRDQDCKSKPRKPMPHAYPLVESASSSRCGRGAQTRNM
jgi:hypothetical protein